MQKEICKKQFLTEDTETKREDIDAEEETRSVSPKKVCIAPQF